MFITLNRINDSINGTYIESSVKPGPISFGVKYSEEKWKKMVDLQTQSNNVASKEELDQVLSAFAGLAKDDLKSKVETACPDLFVNQATGKFYLKVKDRVINTPIPVEIAERILKSVDLGMDPKPLVKACIRFFRNPNFTPRKFEYFAWYINQQTLLRTEYDKLIEQGYTEELAQERATVFQVPITFEGLLCTHKVSEEVDFKYVTDDSGNVSTAPRYKTSVDEDTGLVTYDTPEFMEDRIFRPTVQKESGDEFWMEDITSGVKKVGHRIKVGSIHYLDSWDKVNTNDEISCVKGLHVGNLDYIRGYQTAGTVTHEVFIDPMDIGAIVDDNTGAIRVRRYFVHRSFMGPNRSLYFSSHYASKTDAEWNTIKSEIVKDRETVALEQAELDGDLLAL